MDEHRPFASRSFDHLVGLPLSEARRVLQEDNACAAWPLQVVETAPPQAPQRSARATPRKVKNETTGRTVRPEKQFGNWRVLRCTVQRPAASDEQPGLQLLVAREELKPLAVEAAIKNAAAEGVAAEGVRSAGTASFEA